MPLDKILVLLCHGLMKGEGCLCRNALHSLEQDLSR